MAKIDWQEADGTAATVTRTDGRGGPTFEVVFTYKVDGEWYGGTFTTTEEYHEGDSVAVRYEPKHPEVNDLVVEEQHKLWITLGILAAMVIVAVVLFVLTERGR